jgi:hypothetical protein
MTTKTANECPSSRSPNGVRRGALTETLRDGTPEAVVSERTSVSGEILESSGPIDARSVRRRKSGVNTSAILTTNDEH